MGPKSEHSSRHKFNRGPRSGEEQKKQDFQSFNIRLSVDHKMEIRPDQYQWIKNQVAAEILQIKSNQGYDQHSNTNVRRLTFGTGKTYQVWAARLERRNPETRAMEHVWIPFLFFTSDAKVGIPLPAECIEVKPVGTGVKIDFLPEVIDVETLR